MSDTLMHFGVQGMKWGIRKDKNRIGRQSKETPTSSDHKQKQKLQKKQINQMSNDELRTINNRLQLERQYKDLTKKDISAGQKFVTGILKDVSRDLIKSSINTGIKKVASSGSKSIQTQPLNKKKSKRPIGFK